MLAVVLNDSLVIVGYMTLFCPKVLSTSPPGLSIKGADVWQELCDDYHRRHAGLLHD